ELKDILPWAEQCSPLVGAVGSGRYNAYFELGTISDTNKILLNSIQGAYKLNDDNIGEKPGYVFEVQNFKVNDSFIDPNTFGSEECNPFGNLYTPSTYSNSVKGLFSIPNVGAHV